MWYVQICLSIPIYFVSFFPTVSIEEDPNVELENNFRHIAKVHNLHNLFNICVSCLCWLASRGSRGKRENFLYGSKKKRQAATNHNCQNVCSHLHVK